MLKRCSTEQDIRLITDYIGSDIKRAPYIYINANKYGKGTPFSSSWFDYNSEGNIIGIYLLYYDCLHFYSKNGAEYPVNRLLDEIERISPKVIMIQHDLGERIAPFLDTGYSVIHNHIMDMDHVGTDNRSAAGCVASEADIEQIIRLLITDEEYSNIYTEDVLRNQLLGRFRDGFSRFFVIRENEEIIASCSTYGEALGLTILGGVIVDPGFRRKGFASRLDVFACRSLRKEGKSVISFVSSANTASFSMHLGIGAVDIGIMDKFVKKAKSEV